MTALAHPIAAATPAPKIRKYKPDALLYVAIAFMWMNVWRFQELVPILGKLKISLILEWVLLLLVVTQTASIRSWKWPKSKIFFAPLLIVAIMLLTLPLNMYRGQGLTFITKDYAPTLLMFVSLAMGIRERDDLDFVAFAHLVGATFYSLWVLKFVSIGSDGRLSDMTYYDANDLGLLLVCALPFAIYFSRPGVKPWKRLVAGISLPMLVLLIVRSGSRGAFLGLIAVAVIVLLRYRAIPNRIRYGSIVAGIALMSVFGSAHYWETMKSILHPNDDYNTTSPVGRKAVWKRGVGYMLERPVFGVGAAAFSTAEGRLSETSKEFEANGGGFKWSTAHNSFVLVAAEEGVPGILLFVSMIWLLIRQLSAVRPPPRGSPLILPADAAFAQAMMVSVVGFCVAGFFVSATYSPGFYVIGGLGVAQLAVLRRRAVLTPPQSISVQSMQRPTLTPRQRRLLRPTWTPAA